ncbi:MAG: hypothetical protein CBE00_00015 [Planctomycetaceae bacterium TMED240]|nr:hypothetical protein [Rhodopirellula sp.]OUX09094.1 MAG: hypothetical protein CBE00_00015 [Planctomycetaceae bacterium TMED240]
MVHEYFNPDCTPNNGRQVPHKRTKCFNMRMNACLAGKKHSTTEGAKVSRTIHILMRMNLVSSDYAHPTENATTEKPQPD